MSGSYDDPHSQRPVSLRARFDPRLDRTHTTRPAANAPSHAQPTAGDRTGDDPATVSASARPGGQGGKSGGRGKRRRGDLVAPARPARALEGANTSRIVPPDSVTGSSLTLVIAIMCFLACLTTGAVYMVNQSAEAWTRNIASEVTVQLEPVRDVNLEQRVTEVSLFLAKMRGVTKVSPLPASTSRELLEPWLGKASGLDSLPVPRLIALEVNRSDPPDFEQMREALRRKFPGVTVDDHRQWQTQIRAVTRSLALGGLGILVLVGAATMAILVSATRSAMASNREIVQVLHFVGATDRYIAREFEKHFLNLGIRAGLIGAGLAMIVFLIMPGFVNFIGGGEITAAEMRRLIGNGSLDMPGYFLLGIVVVVIAGLCMITCRYSVFRILHSHS